MKLLKKKLLFALASEVDLSKKSQKYEYQTYKFLYFRLSEFKEGSIRDGVRRLFRKGLVDKVAKNRKTLIRLTSLGREKLLLEVKAYKGQVKAWDSSWRVVITNDLKGSSRALGVRLGALGYKRVSRGVYITPLRVSEETRELFLEDKWLNKAQVIESKRLIVGDDRQMAKNLWHLEEVGEKYLQFVTLADRVLKLSRKSIVLIGQSKGGFRQVFNAYFNLLMLDPGLPKKLLPSDWQAEKARELFLRLTVMAKTAGV